MAISDESCARFEGIGVEPIRRELAVGNVFYLHGPEMRRQAQEWVVEQDAKLAEGTKSGRRIENIKYFVALFVSVVAAVAAMIAAWPVIKEWLR
jgi:hypothetical protein